MIRMPVEFRTIDGVTLRGQFYQADGNDRPIIVMTAGFPMLKEHYAPAFAERFAAAGYSALLFDYRGWGSSAGMPRYETNLYQQANDLRDAVTAAARLPGVDPKKVLLWGIGHAGAVAIIAAADDSRVAGVILQTPAISGRHDSTLYGEKIITKAWAIREMQTVSGDSETRYIKPWADTLEEARDPEADTMLHGEGTYYFRLEALKASEPAGTSWENKLSALSVLNVVSTEARDFLYKISAPTLYVVFPKDPITGDADFHREAFNTMSSRAEFKIAEPINASTITDFLVSTIDTQLEFIGRFVG